MVSEIFSIPTKSHWQAIPPANGDQGWKLEDCEPPLLPPYVTQGGVGLTLQWETPNDDRTTAPWVSAAVDPPITLPATSPWRELRLWLRSDRPAEGSSTKPFYLGIGMNAPDGGDFSWRHLPWKRLLPVCQADKWELQRFWLADAPEMMHNLCLFGLPISHSQTAAEAIVPSFQITLGDLRVTRSEVLSDADQALQSAIAIAIADLVESNGNHDETAAERLEAASERVVFVVPEVQESAAKPYVRVIPWSIKPKGARGGSGELVDNYTVRPLTALAEDAPAAPQWVSMAYQRPTPSEVVIAYAIEVVGRDRLEITTYQSAILNHFSRYPWLMIDGELLGLRPFHPSPEEIANLSATGRNPLFFELSVLVERGDRQPQDLAYPRLIVGDISKEAADLPVQLFATPAHR